jgi:hypothetical protein
MITRITRPFGAGILALLLSGCTSGFLNEGATKVRSSTVASPGETPKFKSIYYKPESQDTSIDKRIIRKGEYFSISLLSAYICGFREGRGLDMFSYDHSNPRGDEDAPSKGCNYGGAMKIGRDDRVTRGEISILANAGEASNTKSLSINPSDASAKGRVIYYNDDIRESGQLINAVNLPIYGPKEYQGKNVIFELWMLELDNEENNEVRSLLDTLSELGGKAYPPSSPILGVLNTLGGAFLSGNQDDVEARFQMRFDVPAGDNSSIARLVLAEGYYAFVREENRDMNPEWDRFTVNEGMGELCSADAETGKCKSENNNTYRDRTWFLVRIARESRESALDIEYGEQLAVFLEQLETHESADLNKTKSALDNLGIELTSLVCGNASDKKKQ